MPLAPTAKAESNEPLEVKKEPKNENLKDLMRQFYGYQSTKLVAGMKVRAKWGNYLFTMSQDMLDIVPSNVALRDDLKPQIESEISHSSGHDVIVDGHSLAPNEIRFCEASTILNTGYSVLSMDWADKFLIVSQLVSDIDPIDQNTNINPDGPGLLKVYITDLPQVKLANELHFPDLGSINCVKFGPKGQVACVFSSGRVGLLNYLPKNVGSYKVEAHGKQNENLGKDSIEMYMISTIDSMARSICWRKEFLVIGYDNGCVSEHNVDEERLKENTHTNYVVQCSSSVITRLTANRTQIFSTSVDGHQCIIDINDPRLTEKVYRLKFYSLASGYNKYINSFLFADDQGSVRIVPALRGVYSDMSLDTDQASCGSVCANTTSGTLSQHTAEITALATSNSHPFVVTGCRHGSVHLINACRKALVTRRQKDAPTECEVWRLECSHLTSEYRFVEVFDTVSKLKPNLNQLMPFTVNISETVWQPNGTWFAAATLSGLIRFDNVNC